jgi:hypothetical protein
MRFLQFAETNKLLADGSVETARLRFCRPVPPGAASETPGWYTCQSDFPAQDSLAGNEQGDASKPKQSFQNFCLWCACEQEQID